MPVNTVRCLWAIFLAADVIVKTRADQRWAIWSRVDSTPSLTITAGRHERRANHRHGVRSHAAGR